MKETQQTVGQWINDTFPGTDPESPRKSLRLLEEVVELCLASGASYSDVIAATKKAVDASIAKIPGGIEEHQLHAFRAPNPDKIAEEAADAQIVLYGIAHMRKFVLAESVDSKMEVNRKRRWRANGDGTGYHIPE